jgi:hypothetical protein
MVDKFRGTSGHVCDLNGEYSFTLKLDRIKCDKICNRFDKYFALFTKIRDDQLYILTLRYSCLNLESCQGLLSRLSFITGPITPGIMNSTPKPARETFTGAEVAEGTP